MTKKQWIGLVALLTVLLGFVTWNVLRAPSPAPGITVHEPAPGKAERRPAQEASLPSVGRDIPASPSGDSAQRETPTDIVVQVVGAVRRPGVYHLAPGARNDDAVKAAGGLSSDANAASVNLAARAVDGAQLYIKTTKEQPVGGAPEETLARADELGRSPLSSPSVHAAGTHRLGRPARSGSGHAQKLKDPVEGKININTAPAAELQRIPNVGPAMAQKIIAYREENHGFASVDDLLQVSGIGEKKLAKMAPFVRVR